MATASPEADVPEVSALPVSLLRRRLSVAILLAVLTVGMAGAIPANAFSTIVPAAARAPGARHGIDVSHWQGRIHWFKVRKSGIRFAIAKATEGLGGVDKTYRHNAIGARRAGVAFTAYHFARPNGGVANARAQADFFVNTAKLQGGDLVPALDLERAGGLGAAALQRWVLAFLKRVEQRLGVKPMIYTSPGFWTGHMANTRTIVKAGYQVLWVAHYGTAKPSVPAKKWNGRGWTIWQWTKCGQVSGIKTCVDRDTLNGVRLQNLTIKARKGL